jgi:hypothetical protein
MDKVSKICTQCIKDKPIKEFRTRKYIGKIKISLYLESRCKDCERLRSHLYAVDPKNKIKNKERSLRNYHTKGYARCKENRKKNLKKFLLNTVKYRAKKKGLDFNLIEEDLIIPDYCPLLEIRIAKTGSHKNSANSPSIDRINSSLGYIRGNIRIISYRANILKNSITKEEVYIFYKNMLKYFDIKETQKEIDNIITNQLQLF